MYRLLNKVISFFTTGTWNLRSVPVMFFSFVLFVFVFGTI